MKSNRRFGYYQRYYKETAPLKSGAVELLEKLRNSNIPMTIASSNNKEKKIEMAF